MKKIINKKLALLLAMLIPIGAKSSTLVYAGFDFSVFPDLTGKIDVSKMVDKDIVPLEYPNFLNTSYDEHIAYKLSFDISKFYDLPYLMFNVNGKDTVIFGSYEDILLNTNDYHIARFVKEYPYLEDYEELPFKRFISLLESQEIGLQHQGITQEFVNAYGYFPRDYFVEFVKEGKIVDFLKENNIDFTESDLNPLPDNTVPYINLVEFYFKKIPKEYWPITTESKINVNSSLPIFKDEFLEKPVDLNKIATYMSTASTEGAPAKMILYRIEERDFSLYDYFTGELVLQNQKKINNEYIKKYGMSEDENDSLGTSTYIDIYKEDILGNYPDIYDEYLTIKTHRDLVNWYQKLPIDAQVNYSFYDFKNSPIKENYKGAVKPGSKDFAINYRTNTLYAIPKKEVIAITEGDNLKIESENSKRLGSV